MTLQTRYYVLIALMLLSLGTMKAQGNWSLILHLERPSPESYSPIIFPDSLSMVDYINDEIDQLLHQGHYAAALDSLEFKEDSYHAHIFVGPSFSMVENDRLQHSEISFEKVVSDAYKALKVNENKGFPFAQNDLLFRVGTDSIFIEENLNKGAQFTLDSIIQLGDELIHYGALSAHLRMKKGELYNESRLKKMDTRLKGLPFVKVTRPTQVIFAGHEFRILLAIEKRKANRANGIIGFLPDAEGKVRTTGEVDLLLNNALGDADKMSFTWRRIQDGSQSLDLAVDYPYLFSSPFGVSGSINQFRQDSTFNQIQLKGGISLLLDNGDVISADVERRDFNDLLANTNDIANANSNSLLYGAAYLHSSLDDQFNPFRGMEIVGRVAYGTKFIVSSLTESESSTEQKLDTWEITMDAKRFIPIGKKSTVLIRVNAFHQESDLILFKELQRIGGLFTLRGMDELSIRASTYSILTAEYRFLTDERAYLSVFTDLGYHTAEVEDSKQEDTPYGLGLGTAFDTGGGVFTLSYALGSQFGTPISFRTGKVHFGFIALF